MKLLFFVSGHGFGHATRMAEVIRELHARQPTLEVDVRTMASIAHFPAFARVEPCDCGPSIVEDSQALRVDLDATIQSLREFKSRCEDLIKVEVERCRDMTVKLIVSDIPFFAGFVAEAMGTKAIGISNFTWDFILEPALKQVADGDELMRFILDGYERMDLLLQLPLGHPVVSFRNVRQVPLIARKGERSRNELLAELGVRNLSRPIILMGMRGGHSAESLVRVAERHPDYQFLTTRCDLNHALSNLTVVQTREGGYDFVDIMAVSDVVVSKLGYGVLSSSIANDVAILWPRREGFREDTILEREAARLVRSQEIPVEDFMSSNWEPYLSRLLESSSPSCSLPIDGAQVCADHVLSLIS